LLILLGEMEAKRGLIESARRHTRLGLSILSPQRNLWLESVAKNNLVAIAIMLCDLRQGIDLAERGRDLAEESGSAAMIRAFVANLGNLYYLMGDFSSAVDCFERALGLLPSSGEYSSSSWDSLARVALVRDDLSA